MQFSAKGFILPQIWTTSRHYSSAVLTFCFCLGLLWIHFSHHLQWSFTATAWCRSAVYVTSQTSVKRVHLCPFQCRIYKCAAPRSYCAQRWGHGFSAGAGLCFVHMREHVLRIHQTAWAYWYGWHDAISSLIWAGLLYPPPAAKPRSYNSTVTSKAPVTFLLQSHLSITLRHRITGTPGWVLIEHSELISE